jgi:hypothetical protein
MRYTPLVKDIIKFLVLDMGNPSAADFAKFLKDCRGVGL